MTYDLIVIGGGPAGYTGAIRAAQLGMRVVVVEREPMLGGTCLRVGCIPSKSLLESSHLWGMRGQSLAAHGILGGERLTLDLAQMHRRKDEVVRQLGAGIGGLFKKHKIDHVSATASLVPELASGQRQVRCQDGRVLVGRRVLLATGSQEARLPGVELDGEWVGTSTTALAYPRVPEHLVVIGAGAIGLELGSVWARLGARVTVLEYAERILPGMDADLAKQAERQFARQGLALKLGSRVQRARRAGDGCEVTVEGQPTLSCDRVLMCTGRVPETQRLGVEGLGIQLDARGRIPVDGRYQTSAPEIYAVGDVIAGPMLAHKAEEEAVACAEMMAGGAGHVDYKLVPYVVYTQPEVASVGAHEEALKAERVDYRVGRFPFLANARARAAGETVGFVKLLACARTDRLLGGHILGSHASEQIAEVGAAMAFGASSEDLARTCHAHPTQAEAVREAALAVQGRTLNL